MQNDFGSGKGEGAGLARVPFTGYVAHLHGGAPSAEAPAGPVTWTAADVHRLDLALLNIYGVPLPATCPASVTYAGDALQLGRERERVDLAVMTVEQLVVLVR